LVSRQATGIELRTVRRNIRRESNPWTGPEGSRSLRLLDLILSLDTPVVYVTMK